ncbi:hypothetical protein DPM19_19355 [Actinomadura craniellae]|uniref:non-specific serine/threonine protein kinase n=1 Tax=Actinomadura craniellae TaxID=2231787 RepID=A0A365H3Y8_9ACTN|nr:protein kinase [Actinomadura craniellae]RAY13811.1 hypothetical protein DPM19_19355 [Actinomadura craniellae]
MIVVPPRRRALSIGVRSAGHRGGPLPFAPELARELARSLGELGYSPTVRDGPRLPTRALGDAVASHLDGAGVVVVHLISHGDVEERTGTLWVPGTDGAAAGDATDVESWLKRVERDPDGPLVLFLLDLCQAGTAARLPWQIPLAHGRVRAWVLAACESDQAAFNGHFSQALINVLGRIGDLDVGPALEHVPYNTVVGAVRREVDRLAVAADTDRQQVIGTLVDSAADLSWLPFFPNPAYDPADPKARLRAGLDPGLLPFFDDLDEVLDARHFIERAAGAGPFRRSPGFTELAGCFTGRRKELRRLSWLLGGESPDAPAEPLGVVTGSPGAGKSALLGVLVCALHPGLREPTRRVWEHVGRALFETDGPVAAVHARGRRLDEVVGSLARQLGLGELDFPDDLGEALRRAPRPPAIVLDALDEAENGPLLMDELVLPLVRARRPDGTPLVRLVVGVRRYGDYAPLRDLARRDALLVDLDGQPREVLEDDLEEYVTELLHASDAYRGRAAVRRAFARGVAATLSAEPEEGVRHRWGEFLVAGLYTRHLVAATLDRPVGTPGEARTLGRQVPRALPQVLTLDLDIGTSPLLRPVMLALARTYGNGMPLSVLRRVCRAYLDGGAEPAVDRLREALDAGRFYLRQATDVDGTTLYRLFHQGLADHLLGRGGDARFRAAERTRVSAFLDLLLAPLGPAEERDWAAAEPYVLRHALQHAADAGRLDELVPTTPVPGPERTDLPWAVPADQYDSEPSSRPAPGLPVEARSGHGSQADPDRDWTDPNPWRRAAGRPGEPDRDSAGPNPWRPAPGWPGEPDRDWTDPNPWRQSPERPGEPNHDSIGPNPWRPAPGRPGEPDRDWTDPNPWRQSPERPGEPNHDSAGPNPWQQSPERPGPAQGASVLGRAGQLEEIYAREAWQPRPDLLLGGRWRLVAPLDGSDQAGNSAIWTAVPAGDPAPEVLVKLVPTGAHGSATRAGVLRRRALRNDMRVRTTHPHIRALLGSGEEQGFAYVVMPRYDPGSLTGVFAAAERTLDTVLRIAEQVLDGLAAAHRAGLVHLDVKPGNIVLDRGDAKIIDWGLSAQWNTEPGREPMTGGTPFFAAPEQILQPPGWCTPLADLYGAGALLYWMITGRAPLTLELSTAATPGDIVRHLDGGGRPERVDRLVPGIPADLGRLVDRWLSRVPQQRNRQPAPLHMVAEVARNELRAARRAVPGGPLVRLPWPGRRTWPTGTTRPLL